MTAAVETAADALRTVCRLGGQLLARIAQTSTTCRALNVVSALSERGPHDDIHRIDGGRRCNRVADIQVATSTRRRRSPGLGNVPPAGHRPRLEHALHRKRLSARPPGQQSNGVDLRQCCRRKSRRMVLVGTRSTGISRRCEAQSRMGTAHRRDDVLYIGKAPQTNKAQFTRPSGQGNLYARYDTFAAKRPSAALARAPTRLTIQLRASIHAGMFLQSDRRPDARPGRR
jgi:hypothetical protein